MGVERGFISLTPRLFIQQVIRANSKRGPSNTNELPLHKTSNLEIVSMPWRHLEGWKSSFIISLVAIPWHDCVSKLVCLLFKHWLRFCLEMGWQQLPWLMLSESIIVCQDDALWASRRRPISQRASNAQSISMTWHGHEKWQLIKHFLYFIHWCLVYCFNWRLGHISFTDLSSLAPPCVVMIATCHAKVNTLLAGWWTYDVFCIYV